MANIVGVRFQNAGKLYYFDPNGLWPTPGDYVVVETNRGIFLGEAVTDIHEIEEEKLEEPLKPVIRIATQADLARHQENKASVCSAFDICKKKIEEHELEMKLVSVEYTLDRNKIIFYFSAKARVDFRVLVKDLASTFHTRIELRQIGPRDEAKMVGGLGSCGRPVCCGTFLGECRQVSLRMAKEQNLAVNPAKTSGLCGRLMCCLRFEQEVYEEARRRMPKVGRSIQTPDGEGTVSDLNIIRETVRVRISKGDSFEVKEYPLTILGALNNWQPEEPKASKESAEPESEAFDAAQAESVSAGGDLPSAEMPEEAQAAAPQASSDMPREKKEAPERSTKPQDRPAKAPKAPVRRNAQPRSQAASSAAQPAKQASPAAAAPASEPAQPAASAVAASPAAPAPAAASPQPVQTDKKTSWREALERAKKAAQGQENT